MQGETKARFSGQVKPAGTEKNMNWKLGSVDFDYDSASDSWLVKLYFKVKPNSVHHQMKIGKSDQLDVKCGRLMIENKKGDGIHIRLSDNDVTSAKLLVEKIKNSIAVTPSYNRAEVGVTSAPALSSHKGSENVRPIMNEYSSDKSTLKLRGDSSPEHQSRGWISKMTPPMKTKEHNPPPKRRLELFSPERERLDKGVYSRKGENEERHALSQKFTGMKDYSKRDIPGGNGMSLASGLGTKSFYGSQNLVMSSNSHGSSPINSDYIRSSDNSPALKKFKLSSTQSFGSHRSNSMSVARVSSSSSPPVTSESNSGNRSQDSSLLKDESPRQYRGAGETIGFENLGNTCFLNSPLQCLSSLEPLSLDIQSAVAEYGSELNANSMTRKLYLLMKDVRKLDVCPERVRDILIRLRRDMNVKFAPNTQQDAHELLSELLNRIDEEVKSAIRLRSSFRSPLPAQEITSQGGACIEGVVMLPSSKEDKGSSVSSPSPAVMYTPTEANFCWSYRTCIFFQECKTKVLSAQTEQEMTLMLAFDSSTRNLQDCINKYFESTEVEMKCEKCGRDEKATITRKIVRRPRIFILNLLRYHTDNMETTKKADQICIPSYISVRDYCADDVIKPPQVDPVFMLERDAHLGLNSLDNVERFTCDRDDSEPLIKIDSFIGNPSSPSVKPCQENSPSSSVTAEAGDFDLPPELSVDLEQFVPGYSFSESISSRGLSYLDMSRHVVNRVFVPLHLHTDSGITDHTTDFDDDMLETPFDLTRNLSLNPLHDGRDSGKIPPVTGDDFLIQTKKICIKSENSADRSLADASVDLPDLIADFVTAGVHEKKCDKSAAEEARTGSTSQSIKPDSSTESRENLSVLVEGLSSNLRFVDRFVEDAQEKRSDIRELYDGAWIVISEIKSTLAMHSREGSSVFPENERQHEESPVISGVPVQEMLLCQELLKRALNLGDNPLGTQNDVLQRVIEELITTRYDHMASQGKSLTHLIEDLALCVCAMHCGILMSDAQTQKDATERVKMTSRKPVISESKSVRMPPDGGFSSATKVHDDGNLWLEDENFKTSSSLHDYKDIFMTENDFTKTNNHRTAWEVGERFAQDISCVKERDSVWKDEHSDEENCIDFRKPANVSSETQFLCSPDRSIQMLQGKNIRLYTEADLQKVDCASLTEDEMLIYAQALSRFAYEKEQAVQMRNTADDLDDLMDICNSFDTTQDNSANEVTDSKVLSGGQKDGSHMSSIDVDVGAPGVNSRSSFAKSDESGFLSPSKTISSVGKGNKSNEQPKSEMESCIESSLHCQEDLNDKNEVDRKKHDSESQNSVSGAKCGNIWESSSHTTECHMVSDVDLAPPKHCVSCGSLYSIVCTVCGAVDQTDFDLNPSGNQLLSSDASALFCESKTSVRHEIPSPKTFWEKCVESPNHVEPVEDSELLHVENALDKVKPSSQEEVKSLPQESLSLSTQTESSHSQFIPPSPLSASRKEYLFSPSKTNNLVKTRDYARLRSPSASPKKKASSKGSVSKRLHFSEEEKSRKIARSGSHKEDSSNNNSEFLSASLEVNVDDISFLDTISGYSFSCSSTLNTDHHSTPKLNNNKTTPSLSKSLASNMFDDATPSRYLWNNKLGSTSASFTSAVEESNLLHIPSHASQQSNLKVDQVAISSNSGKVREINLQENMESESSSDVRVKTNKQPIAIASDIEEKENVYRDQVTAKQFQNTELGQADLSYKLVGVVDHTGTTQFTGHYTAYAFNMSKQKWFHLNDSETQVVTEREVQENNTQTGYLFFYMDKDLFQEYRDKVASAPS